MTSNKMKTLSMPSFLSQVVSSFLRLPFTVKTALGILGTFYSISLLAPWVAPYGEHEAWDTMALLPPTPIYLRAPEKSRLAPQAPLLGNVPYILTMTRRSLPEAYWSGYTPAVPFQPQSLCMGCVTPQGWKLFGVKPITKQPTQVNSQAHGVHLLGLDANGRDRLSRLIWGSRISLFIGFFSLLIAFPIGLLWGGTAAMIGGRTDTLMMRIAEVLMSIPGLYLLMCLSSLLPNDLTGATRFVLVSLILSFIGWAPLSRVVRGLVLSVKKREFVDVAFTLGASPWRVLTRHLLPQTWGYCLVSVMLAIPGSMLAESGLSFLGLGIQEPDASWGNMLRECQNIETLTTQPWVLAPGVLLCLSILAFNWLGEYLRKKT